MIYIYNYPDGFVDVAKWGDGPSEMVYFLSVLQVSHILLYPLVKSPCLMGKSTINGPCATAMLVYHRVSFVIILCFANDFPFIEDTGRWLCNYCCKNNTHYHPFIELNWTYTNDLILTLKWIHAYIRYIRYIHT